MPEPFSLTTGDPAFDPRRPIKVNGYLFVPADGRADRPRSAPPGRRSVVEVQRKRKVLANA